MTFTQAIASVQLRWAERLSRALARELDVARRLDLPDVIIQRIQKRLDEKQAQALRYKRELENN